MALLLVILKVIVAFVNSLYKVSSISSYCTIIAFQVKCIAVASKNHRMGDHSILNYKEIVNSPTSCVPCVFLGKE